MNKRFPNINCEKNLEKELPNSVKNVVKFKIIIQLKK